jgi:small subunit ribosomal protein S9
MAKPLVQSTGRRKRAVARVRLRTGEGAITINKRPFEEYFPSETHRTLATEPLRIAGQAGALRLGIARGLIELEADLRGSLKKAGMLTRDAREKESKKYGLKKARKAPQYSKR